MITQSEAEKIAYDHINQPNPYWTDMPEMVITETEERKLGWLFYWTSSRYLETKNISDVLAGNGPIYVSEETGSFEPVGTAPPLEERIAQAEERLKS